MSRMSMLLGLLLLFSSAMVWGQTTYPPVFHVTMDEQSGNIVNDISGNGNNGLATGTTIVEGCDGLARQFGTSSDYVTIPDDPAIDFVGDFTITAWVIIINSTNDGKIIYKNNSYESDNHYQLNVGGSIDSMRFCFQLGYANDNKVFSPYNLSLNTCVMLTAVREGNEMKIYTNGEPAGATTCDSTDQSNSADLLIGKHALRDDQNFPGVIDEIRMYDYALTESEIQYIYESSGSYVGTIAGVVSCEGEGLLGVPVVVIDNNGDVYGSAVTDEAGQYGFVDVPNGDYTVGISTPLGYQTVEESKLVSVQGGGYTVDFVLDKQVIASDIRTLYYWTSMVYNALLGHPKDYTLDDFSHMANLIAGHFNANGVNPVDYYNVPQPATQVDSITVLRRILCLQSDDPTEEYKRLKAKAQLMALILNVVSGKVSQTEVISNDNMTVSQAITYCDLLINDDCDVYEPYGAWFEYPYPVYRYVMAGYILTLINNSYPISAGMIDPNTTIIAYKGQNQLPDGLEVSQNYPNPFNPTTSIRYTLPEQAEVTIDVFNIAGQKVATLVNESQEAGEHSVVWDSKDNNGRAVSSGIYFYRLTAGAYSDTKKMVLLK